MTVKELMKKTEEVFKGANIETHVDYALDSKFPRNVNKTGAPVVSFSIEKTSSTNTIYVYALI